MPMRSLREMLIAHEGVRQKPYDDATSKPLRPGHALAGKLTIGVGRNLSDRGLTRSEVNVLLDHDIIRATRGARQYGWFDGLSEPRQAVCISMVFCCGSKGWSLFKLTHAALAEGRWEDAAVQLLDSRFAEQVGDRALHLAEMIRTGRWLDT
jgi:lysozyme